MDGDHVERAGLRVTSSLVALIETQALPGTGIAAEDFWHGAAQIFANLTPDNRALLATRDRLQAAIDDWHEQRRGRPFDGAAYRAFLTAIGYLVAEPAPFTIATSGVDDEVARIAGPQLVVPILNPRFLLNAANARWGSLYDALYGTDALGDLPGPGGYDPARGARVIARARAMLDEAVPLAAGGHADQAAYRVVDGALRPALAAPEQFVGYRGDPDAPSALLFRHHGLGIELILDRTTPIGRADPAGVADVRLEAALTTIADLEDSVAAVDAEDKVAAYANWLALIDGTLEARFEKAGGAVTRVLAEDRAYTGPDGRTTAVAGRSLMFLRNVGHLMTTPAILLPDGGEAPEGVLDAIVSGLIGLRDVQRLGRFRNSRTGAIYIVKPKMHGPDEAAFADRLFDAVEDLLGLPRHTVKIGVMDEERRTSANLAACIHAVRGRIAFVNTGFLDRTGDEIHTSMRAGAMLRKADIKAAPWLKAYEDRNVRIGLACGLAGRAQIGKGMWPEPDNMAAMLRDKVAHPRAGANTAWVPSPTAATLHALHYHMVDVAAVQAGIAGEPAPPLDRLLSPPLADGRNWSAEDIRAEIENNAQGILGYVSRWVEQGIGCSKVPDIRDVALMEDRATLRISSQHLANWLLHGVVSADEVEDALLRMARRVDAQNAGDPDYRPMADDPARSEAFQAARALVFEGLAQPNGYTEPLLHRFRHRVKDAQDGREAFAFQALALGAV